MPKWKVITIVLVIAGLVALTWLAFQPPATPSAALINASSSEVSGTAAFASGNATQTVGGLSGGSIVGTSSTNNASKASGSSDAVAPLDITITSPAANAEWSFEEPHTIIWSRAAGASTGSIYIVNAKDGSVTGWILEEAGQNQSSFIWNTRDIYLTATSGVKKDIAPGEYVIKIQFNSPGSPVISSAPFSIVGTSSTP